MSQILIIEDDPLVARMYQKVFKFEGQVLVDLAADGQVGLEKARTLQPDLILCDVMMPRMNGMEVLDALKADENLKDIPVVMLTNLSGTRDAKLALKKGAVAYLVKSEFKPKEVAEKVRVLLRGKTVAQVAPKAAPKPETVPVPKPAPTPTPAPKPKPKPKPEVSPEPEKVKPAEKVEVS